MIKCRQVIGTAYGATDVLQKIQYCFDKDGVYVVSHPTAGLMAAHESDDAAHTL
ncbi:MAG: hypothetical protein V4624_08370 [Pseudomonadota bacterium]|jgi:hypothetical protein